MERIKGNGKGKLQKENDVQIHEVSYFYQVMKGSADRGILSGTLVDIDWEIGKTLNGAICDLYLEDDGLPRKILVSMSSPFSPCTFTSAPGGIDWPGM